MRILCTACHPSTVTAGVASNLSPLAAIWEMAQNAATVEERVNSDSVALSTPSLNKVGPGVTPSRVCQHHQCCLTDTFLIYPAKENSAVINPGSLIISLDSSAPVHALISIGPNTDAVLDQFELGDNLLLCLHHLITSIWSSCWEVILRLAPWNLSYEQASNLSKAITADLRGTSNFSVNMVQFAFPISRSDTKLIFVLAAEVFCPYYCPQATWYCHPNMPSLCLCHFYYCSMKHMLCASHAVALIPNGIYIYYIQCDC